MLCVINYMSEPDPPPPDFEKAKRNLARLRRIKYAPPTLPVEMCTYASSQNCRCKDPRKCPKCVTYPGRLDESHNSWVIQRIRRGARLSDDDSDPETWMSRAMRDKSECEPASAKMSIRAHKRSWRETLFSDLATHVYGKDWKDRQLTLIHRVHDPDPVQEPRFTYEIDKLDKIIKDRLFVYLHTHGIKYNYENPYENVVNYIIHRRSIGIHDNIHDMCILLGKTDAGPETIHGDQFDFLVRELHKRDMWPLKGALSEGGRLKTRKCKNSKSKSKKRHRR